MLGKFKVVHLCGTTRGRYELFKDIEYKLTERGYIVFKPVFYVLDVYNYYKDMVDDMCYEKLLVSDILCIVTLNETYPHIGTSTRLRITQARELMKQVMIWKNNDMVEFNE